MSKTVTENTVISMYSPQIAALSDWEAVVSMGVMLVEGRDEYSWKLGELASFVRTSSPIGGRPRTSDKLGTLSAFADDIGMRRESVSAMCSNWEFFQSMRDDLPENVTWHQLSEARRKSGWRPGAEIEPQHRQHALEIANEYADAGSLTGSRKRTLAERLADERERLRSIADRDDAGQVRHSLALAVDILTDAIEALE